MDAQNLFEQLKSGISIFDQGSIHNPIQLPEITVTGKSNKRYYDWYNKYYDDGIPDISLHDALDGVGLVPGIGEFADGANAVYYLFEGDYVNASLSGTAMIPFVGWGSSSIKWGNKVGLRKVGSLLESVDDVMINPNLLEGQSYVYFRNMLGESEGWVNSTMTKTRGSDKGWVLRQVNHKGQETGRLIQYHPGSRRHFGGAPYWKISDGANVSRFKAAN